MWWSGFGDGAIVEPAPRYAMLLDVVVISITEASSNVGTGFEERIWRNGERIRVREVHQCQQGQDGFWSTRLEFAHVEQVQPPASERVGVAMVLPVECYIFDS